MAEDMLKRNLDIAFDAGSGFPSSLWLSRTMAALEYEKRSTPRRVPRYASDWWWRSRRLVAAIALIILAIAATAAFLTIHRSFAPTPVHPTRFRVLSPGTPACTQKAGCGVGSPVFASTSLGWIAEVTYSPNASVGDTELFATTDGGRHWDARLDLGDDMVQQILFAGSGADILVVGSSSFPAQALDRSTDGGHTWRTYHYPSQIHSVWPPAGALVCARVAPQIFFLSVDEGWVIGQSADYRTALVFHTIDGGATWSQSGTFDIPSQLHIDVVAGLPCKTTVIHELSGEFQFASSTTGYFITGAGNPVLYRTDDGGLHWSPLIVPIPASDLQQNGLFPSLTLLRPGDVFLQLGQYVFVSHDAGRSWLPPIKPPLQGPIQFINPSNWAGWPDQGGWISTTDAGQHWQTVAASHRPGIEAPQPGAGLPGGFPMASGFQMLDPLHGFALVPRYSGGGGAVLYQTADGGTNWTPVSLPEINRGSQQ